MGKSAYEGISDHSRLPGQTLHIVEALESEHITPDEFIKLRSEIMRDDDALRFFKSALTSRRSKRNKGVAGS